MAGSGKRILPCPACASFLDASSPSRRLSVIMSSGVRIAPAGLIQDKTFGRVPARWSVIDVLDVPAWCTILQEVDDGKEAELGKHYEHRPVGWKPKAVILGYCPAWETTTGAPGVAGLPREELGDYPGCTVVAMGTPHDLGSACEGRPCSSDDVKTPPTPPPDSHWWDRGDDDISFVPRMASLAVSKEARTPLKSGNPSNFDKRSVIAQYGDTEPAEDISTPKSVLLVEKDTGSK